MELNLSLYKKNKKLINSSEEDMEIGISNLRNMDISDTVIIAIAKSLDSVKRRDFISSFVESEGWGEESYKRERVHDLNEKCVPWSEIFQSLKNKSNSDVEKEIVEYEIQSLYLSGISNNDFIKKINLELAW